MAITELFQTRQIHSNITESNENILHIEKSTKKAPSPQITIRPDKYFDPSELYISKIRVNSAIWTTKSPPILLHVYNNM